MAFRCFLKDMKFKYKGDRRVWDGECTVLRARRLLAGAKQEGFYFLTANLDLASAKLHSLFGERLHEVFEDEAYMTWPSYVSSCDDDPAAANAMAGGDSANPGPRYKRVYFVPIVRSKMATDVAGRRSKKTYVSLEAIGPGAFKVKDGLKACKFRWDGEAWFYNRDDIARKSFSQTARDLRAQFAIHRDGIPVRLKPASDEADEMHERMRETPVEEAEVKEEVIEFGVKEEEVEETPVERGAGTNDWRKELVIMRLHQLLRQETEKLEKTTLSKLRKQVERDLGVDLSKHKEFILDEVKKFLKSNPDLIKKRAPPPNRNMAPPPNRKRAAPAASHAGTMMSEARSRPRVRREPDAEATSVKREQSPEPSEATAQFAAGAPNTPGQATRTRRRSSIA